MAKNKRKYTKVQKNKRKYTKVQDIYDRPRKVFAGSYITPKGRRLLEEGKLTKKEVNEKYKRNRYYIDPEAKIIKSITHKDFHRRVK